jgi:hypothetical protein
MRPAPGYADTVADHSLSLQRGAPGGGVTGIPARNCFRQIARPKRRRGPHRRSSRVSRRSRSTCPAGRGSVLEVCPGVPRPRGPAARDRRRPTSSSGRRYTGMWTGGS